MCLWRGIVMESGWNGFLSDEDVDGQQENCAMGWQANCSWSWAK